MTLADRGLSYSIYTSRLTGPCQPWPFGWNGNKTTGSLGHEWTTGSVAGFNITDGLKHMEIKAMLASLQEELLKATPPYLPKGIFLRNWIKLKVTPRKSHEESEIPRLKMEDTASTNQCMEIHIQYTKLQLFTEINKETTSNQELHIFNTSTLQ